MLALFHVEHLNIGVGGASLRIRYDLLSFCMIVPIVMVVMVVMVVVMVVMVVVMVVMVVMTCHCLH
jgi:hypothetical protein